MSQETRRRLEQDPATPTPRYSRGIDGGLAPHVGRFSDGAEELPEQAGGKRHIGRFSDGAEELPEDAGGKRHVGRFSDGIEHETS
jgi:hypothetical protein